MKGFFVSLGALFEKHGAAQWLMSSNDSDGSSCRVM